jgi:predicted negative regulator of RcsB-dependent stress response
MSADTPAPLPAWEQFLEKNFKKLVLLFLAVTAGCVLYGISAYLSHRAEIKAGEAFASAATVEDLDVVLAQHKGSRAAGNALLRKADLLWEQNKKTSSVDALKAFVNEYKDHPLLPQALLALGSKQESLGQRDDARRSFERITNEFAKTELAPLAELRLGDLAWAEGKEDEAKKIYEGLPARFAGFDAGNPFLSQSEERLQWISAKLPTQEVDGPPKPKVEEKKEDPAKPTLPFKLNSAESNPLSPTLLPPDAAAPMPSAPGSPPPAAPQPVTIPVPAPEPAAPPPAPAVPAAPSDATKAPAKPEPTPATASPAPSPAQEKPSESAPPAPAKTEDKPTEPAPKAP